MVPFGNKFEKTNHNKKILDKRKKIDEFIVDVIMIKVDSELVWLD
jgi:hypothetical protein